MAHFSIEVGALPASRKTYVPQIKPHEKRSAIASVKAWRTAINDPRLDQIRRQEAIWSQSLDGCRS